MSGPKSSKLTESLSRHILDSRKQITILFTDIEYSTLHWDLLGDVDGRLMVDQHNRLLFPVIKKFRGKVIKTIGDAIMASFKRPENAVKAAIGIQQVLYRSRHQQSEFGFKVRIGVHTGTGIVERSDVYGDVVNVAAHMQTLSKGDEILISGNTAARLDRIDFDLSERQGFVPKGKQQEIAVYKCDWRGHYNIVGNIQPNSFLPLSLRDRIDIVIFTASSLVLLYFIYLRYIRYFLADYEPFALFSLNPRLFLEAHPIIPATLSAIAVVAGLLVVNLRSVPLATLRLLKGGFGFCIGFFLFYLPVVFLPIDFHSFWSEELFQSQHLFVEALEDNTSLYARPSTTSPIVRTVNGGTLLLLADLVERGLMTWNKVLIGRGDYAWVPHKLPPKIGVLEKRLTLTEKFYFRYQDLYALLMGLVGFVWGVVSFRVRPI